MLYDAIVTTDDGEHIYQNIEARSEQHLVDKIHRHLDLDDDDDIIDIEIKKTFEGVGNYERFITGVDIVKESEDESYL